MLKLLLIILGISSAQAADVTDAPIKTIYGSCPNSTIKTIQGKYSLECEKISFQYIEKKSLKMVIQTKMNTVIGYVIDKNKEGILIHQYNGVKTVKTDMKNKCDMNKNILHCTSIENNDIIFDFNFIATKVEYNR